jgi:hypothetical protein
VRSSRASGGTPGKPEFFAEQKMRPDEGLKQLPVLLIFTNRNTVTGLYAIPYNERLGGQPV